MPNKAYRSIPLIYIYGGARSKVQPCLVGQTSNKARRNIVCSKGRMFASCFALMLLGIKKTAYKIRRSTSVAGGKEI